MKPKATNNSSPSEHPLPYVPETTSFWKILFSPDVSFKRERNSGRRQRQGMGKDGRAADRAEKRGRLKERVLREKSRKSGKREVE